MCRAARIRSIFAYEPVWAIGEGVTSADPAYADARQTNQFGCSRVSLRRTALPLRRQRQCRQLHLSDCPAAHRRSVHRARGVAARWVHRYSQARACGFVKEQTTYNETRHCRRQRRSADDHGALRASEATRRSGYLGPQCARFRWPWTLVQSCRPGRQR